MHLCTLLSNLQVLVAAAPLDGAVQAAREVWRSLAELEGPAEPAGPAVPAGAAEPAEPAEAAEAAQPVARAPAAAAEAPVEGSTIGAATVPPAEVEGTAKAGQVETPSAGQPRETAPAVPEAAVQGEAEAEAGAAPAAPTMPSGSLVAGQAAGREEAATSVPAGAAAETLSPTVGGMPHEQQQLPETAVHAAEAAPLPEEVDVEAEPAVLSVPGGSNPAEEEPHPFKPAIRSSGAAEAPAAPEAPPTPAAAAGGLAPAPAFTPAAAGGLASRRVAVTVERLGGPSAEGSPRAGKQHSFLGRLLHTG